MISIQRIYTTDKDNYRFAERLLTTAFPKEERRELSLQRQYTDQNKHFHNNILLANEEPIGFISYWDFDKFIYVEHFAIDETKRNGGYGKLVLSALKEKLGRPIVLEVELPENETSKRRICFYQRQGFQLWKEKYQQPPYRGGDSYLPMLLMAQGELNSETAFDEVKVTLYKKVYGVEN
ncbi:GNAT family N-acetyltransferase [uncultured Bacteroides sp.]|uniref:GNAT family N-acetyltransferase n=1 Tax=uncultured Bacteroides sp. TaxID=162156 RepID=UPI002AAB843D|nr:GNAT family N-acetyltransferase [uncultured Bacteroides sp.]